MSATPEIRLATARDAIRIAEISRDHIEQGLGWRWTPARVIRSMRDPSANVVVAVEQERLVGFAIMEYQQDEAHLVLFAVEPSARRAGIGSALIRWLETSALTAGIGVIRLEARVRNVAARAFYSRLGYREVRIMRGWYRGVEDGVWIAKDLWLRAGAHFADQ
jgi:ribosomal-protein-alanine N-acetyltransferase